MEVNQKTDLASYNNFWYKPGAGTIKQMFWYFINTLFFMNPLFPFSELKVLLLRAFGARIGKGVVIKPSVNIKYPWNLTVGNNSWIGEKVWIDNLSKVNIGPNVCISQGAMLLCGNHDYKKPTFDLMLGEIYLKEGVWIGAKSIVCPGITCHSHSVLSVGSIANNNLEAYSIYRGNPAIKVKDRIIVES